MRIFEIVGSESDDVRMKHALMTGKITIHDYVEDALQNFDKDQILEMLARLEATFPKHAELVDNYRKVVLAHALPIPVVSRDRLVADMIKDLKQNYP